MKMVLDGNNAKKPALFGSNKNEGSFVLGCKLFYRKLNLNAFRRLHAELHIKGQTSTMAEEL